MNIQSLEQQIVSEYGAVKGWIATHPYIATLGALFIGFLIGRI